MKEGRQIHDKPISRVHTNGDMPLYYICTQLKGLYQLFEKFIANNLNIFLVSLSDVPTVYNMPFFRHCG